MPRYWTYQNNKVVGPFLVEELLRLPGYHERSLVSAEEPGGGRGGWNLACNVAEIASFAPKESPAPLSSNDIVQVGKILERAALLDSRIARLKETLDAGADARTAVPANKEPIADLPRELDRMVAEKQSVERILVKVEAISAPSAPEPFPVVDRSFVIMSIDDDLNIRRLLKLRLELKRCRVILQENGPDAIKYLEDPSALKPDLIICDVMMPGMDGYETCRRIRAMGITVPYLFLTSKGSSVDKVRGLEAGADDYILKPFDPHELEAKVARHLRKR